MYCDDKTYASRGSTLTPDPHRHDHDLDELVPAPWPARRRLLVAGLLIVLLVLGGLTWWSGLLAPNLALGSVRGGSVQGGAFEDGRVVDTTVRIMVPVENRGWFTATIDGWEPPTTAGIEWRPLTGVSLPHTLAAGEEAEVVLTASIDDCLEVHAGSAAGFAVTATGPLPGSWSRTLTAPDRGSLPAWRNIDDGGEAIDPTPREPNWLYGALAWGCMPDAMNGE